MQSLRPDPTVRFYRMTFTVPEMADLDAQVALIRQGIAGLRRSQSAGHPLLHGLNWHIEIQRGRSETWRAHVHAIAALKHSGWESEKAVLLRWIELTRRHLDANARAKELKHQHSEEFQAHGNPAASDVEFMTAVGKEAYDSVRYAAKPVRLSVSDRLYAFGVVNGAHLSDVFGELRKKGRADAVSLQSHTGEIPFLRRTHTDNAPRQSRMKRWKTKVLKRKRWLDRVKAD